MKLTSSIVLLTTTIYIDYGITAAEEQRRLLRIAGYKTKLMTEKQTMSYFDPFGLGWRGTPRAPSPGVLYIVAMKEDSARYTDEGAMTVENLKNRVTQYSR